MTHQSLKFQFQGISKKMIGSIQSMNSKRNLREMVVVKKRRRRKRKRRRRRTMTKRRKSHLQCLSQRKIS
jgi:hypothetical protein